MNEPILTLGISDHGGVLTDKTPGEQLVGVSTVWRSGSGARPGGGDVCRYFSACY